MEKYKELKDRQRNERHSYHEYLGLRIHRALSWLNRAEQCGDDADGQLLFLWIAFNAAYAYEIDEQYRQNEKEIFDDFLSRLCQMDTKQRLENLTWNEYSSSIRTLLDNQYVFQPFWDFHNNKIPEHQWQQQFDNAKFAAHRALGHKNTPKVLAIVLCRIYTMRNQLMHGGATWNSKANRAQVRDCSRIMGCLIPVIIEIMMDNQDELWGQPRYPFLRQ